MNWRQDGRRQEGSMRIKTPFFSSFIAAIPLLLPQPLFAQTGATDAAAQLADLNRELQQDLQQQQPDRAIPVLRKIVALEPNDVDALGNLGVLLYFQGQYPEAAARLRSALQLQPDLYKIQALLGIAEERMGNLDGARTDLKTAFRHLQDKKIQIEAGLALIEDDTAEGKLDQAASAAAELQSAAPDDPYILSVVYQVYSRLMDQTLLSMVVVAPDSAEMQIMMAHELVRQGDNPAAIAEYQKALRLNPKLPGAHYELAELLHLSSNPKLQAQAGPEYKAALAVNQYDEGSWRGLGEVEASNENWKAAEQDFKRALALQPSDGEAQTDMAKMLTYMKHPHQAMALLQEAVKEDPTNIVAHYRLSMLYRQAGQPAAAKQEMAAFLHYKALQDQFSKVFRQIRVQSVGPDSSDGAPQK
jgi:tetratricopeptide (TPR) repeat protein